MGGEFAGRRVLVTGAGSGIGLATAGLLVERGSAVVGVGRSDASLASIAMVGAAPFRADVTRPGDRRLLLAAADGIDGLVLAHGETMGQRIEDVTEADWDRIHDANLRSVFFLLQGFAQRLPDHGAIVTLSSIAAKTGMIPAVTVYAAAKAGVLSLTRSFAAAHAARGMRVNSVLPGIIDTPMQRRFLELNAPLHGLSPEALNEERLAATPMQRAGTPGEAAEVILFLLSPRSAYLTGQALNVAGGFVTW
ncbi:MAG: SDR family oxidoreductase [Chloroflexi bacterium]|nr:SDR family oxidoreductase [Chloroflexota bacterium]